MSGCDGKECCLAKAPAAREVVLKAPGCDFAEGLIWDALGGGWQCLHGAYCQPGISVEWHDFAADRPCEWSRSFHPGSIELCFNLSGQARLLHQQEAVLLAANTAILYAADDEALSAWRLPGERHQFLTIEYSPGVLARHLTGHEAALHPAVQFALDGKGNSAHFTQPWALAAAQFHDLELLRQPPVAGPAASLWYHSKALELMAHFFFADALPQPPATARQQAVSRQRIERAVEILRLNLTEPPSLKELGRLVGCSPYHLSRTFSQAVGMTIPRYVRQLRMQRAAELLKSGQFNVTETALEVGYRSLSHFSQAFCETMGICPGLYPHGMIPPALPESPPTVRQPTAIPRQ